MESYSSKHARLLTRFSNAVSLLVFFDDFYTWQKLMIFLCSETRQLWTKNYRAFTVGFEFSRKKVKYFKYFDSEIAEWLLKRERYKKYELQLWVEPQESFQALIEFIEKVSNPEMLKIGYIKFWLTPENAKSYIRLYEVMWEKLSIAYTEEILQNEKVPEKLLYKHSPVIVPNNFISKIWEESDITKFPFIHNAEYYHDQFFVERIYKISYIPETNGNWQVLRIRVSEALRDKINKDKFKLDVFDSMHKIRICFYNVKSKNENDQVSKNLREIEDSKVQLEGVDLEFKHFSMNDLEYISTRN
jgi:hypothetical protein